MQSDRKKTLSAAGVYIGLIVGAGFASGQELLTFFVRFGYIGIAGLLLSGVVLTLCGWAVMDITARLKVGSYNEFMTRVLGRRFGTVMLVVVNVFIAVMFATMLSGFGEAVSEALDWPFTMGVCLLAGLCFIAFLFDLRGIVRISGALAPILVAGGVFFGLYTVMTDYTPVFFSMASLQSSFVWSAVVYASYNLITSVSVLSSMGETLTNRRIARDAGLISGLCLCVLGLCFVLPIYANLDFVSQFSLPLLALSRRSGPIIEILYLVILAAAIFTTAVADGFTVVEWLSGKTKFKKLHIKIFVTLFGAAAAHIGFAAFVGKVYPFFGYVGIFEIVVIILYFFFGKKA